MKLTSIVLLLAVGLLCVSFAESQRPRGGRRPRPGNRNSESTERPRNPNGPRDDNSSRRPKGGPGKGKVLACSDGVRTLECGKGRGDCTGGPLDVTYAGTTHTVNFCERPFKPQDGPVCRVTDADDVDIVDAEVVTCPEGKDCNVGPFPGGRGRKVYMCEIDYLELLKKKACKVGEEEEVEGACGEEGSCTGPVLSVSDVELTFCQKDADDDTDNEEEADETSVLNILNRGKPRCSDEDNNNDDDDNDEDVRNRGPDDRRGRGSRGRGSRGGRRGPPRN